MTETIKAFLNGQKYGEFQAEAEKELEEKLKTAKIATKAKKIWTPWMHPDLVRNPVVFQERSKIERKNQDQAQEKKDIVEKLRDSNSDIKINEENIKRY
ncbi:1673_t:CDS:2, partial [Racocetra persica]